MYTEKLAKVPPKTIYFWNNTDLVLPAWDGMTIIERFLSGVGFIVCSWTLKIADEQTQ